MILSQCFYKSSVKQSFQLNRNILSNDFDYKYALISCTKLPPFRTRFDCKEYSV